MTNSFQDALANKVVTYLKQQFPKKILVLDQFVQESKADVWGFNCIKIFVNEVGQEVHFKTSIKNLNQYLS